MPLPTFPPSGTPPDGKFTATRGNTMSRIRTARPLPPFFNPRDLGAAIFGRIIEQSTNGNGPFVTFAPAAYRQNADEPFQKFDAVAIGLSTDLIAKVEKGDTGRIMLFVLAGFQPTERQPMKLFNVVELTKDEVGELFVTNELAPEWMKSPEVTSTSAPKVAGGDLF